MVTLEHIKERFPKGCEVSCVVRSEDKGIVKHDCLIRYHAQDVYFRNEKGVDVFLYNADTKEFATITKPAPENQLSKYHVPCKGVTIDVYDVLKAFNVVNPATQHAIKKLLKGGERGFKDVNKDYQEAIESIERAIELNK
jgi:hypothetical protein